MRCGFCGFEFEEREGNRGCNSCPMARGCKMIKCPRCNYENPPEPLVIKTVRKLFKRGRAPK